MTKKLNNFGLVEFYNLFIIQLPLLDTVKIYLVLYDNTFQHDQNNYLLGQCEKLYDSMIVEDNYCG